MDDTDSIMTAVQTIFELVYTEFTKAAEEQESLLLSTSSSSSSSSGSSSSSTAHLSSSSSTPPHVPTLVVNWTGLHPDAKHRIDVQARNEVNRLRTVFRQANNTLDSMHGLRLTEKEIDQLFVEQEKQRKILEQLLQIIPQDPATITADSDEVTRYRSMMESIQWSSINNSSNDQRNTKVDQHQPQTSKNTNVGTNDSMVIN